MTKEPISIKEFNIEILLAIAIIIFALVWWLS